MYSYECEACPATFYRGSDLEQHMDDYDHWPECETCPRRFGSQHACEQHMNDLNHWAPTFDCETCDKTFGSQNAAEQHMTDRRHWTPRFPCETCRKKFHTQNAVNQHMHDLEHWAPKFPCGKCGKKFHTQGAADQHMAQLGHYTFYCKDCKKGFEDENNLKMHVNSKIHRGTNVPCPFCKAGYTTASGLTHHLETGSCTSAPKLNRDSILHLVRKLDKRGVITSKQIAWHQAENVTYHATKHAFNGIAWECYLCHKSFNTDDALNAHLNSPTHKQKVYHCPNSSTKCGRKFVALSGLFNHLESEACCFIRFQNVQQYMKSILQDKKLLTFQ